VKAPLALIALVIAGWRLGSAPARPCLINVLNVDRYGTTTPMFGNNSSWDAAGNVRLQCKKQQVFINTDSISVLSGDYVHLFGHAIYRDTAYRITADTMIYIVRTELLQARGHVHAFDKTSGSTMVGPYVDYYRQVKGINDSARVVALEHPTVRYFTSSIPLDTVHQRPYVLTGKTLRGFGQSQLYANEDVTIDRDSLHGDGDSLTFLRGAASVAYLFGKPARLRRLGADSLLVLGHKIRVDLAKDRIQQLLAYDSARVERRGSDVRGDTVRLEFALDKLVLTQSWSRTGLASLRSVGYDIRGDSLAVDTPAEQLREIRVYRQGIIQSPPDSSHQVHSAGDSIPVHPAAIRTATTKADSTAAAPPRNSLWGDRMTATFAQVDSAGVALTRLTGLRSVGKASSLFTRWGLKNGQQTQSVNYTRADTITIVMRSDGDSIGVQLVNARGHVNGVQVDSNEAAFVRKTKSDSTAQPAGTKP
jgi:hypothetical protein